MIYYFTNFLVILYASQCFAGGPTLNIVRYALAYCKYVENDDEDDEDDDDDDDDDDFEDEGCKLSCMMFRIFFKSASHFFFSAIISVSVSDRSSILFILSIYVGSVAKSVYNLVDVYALP